MGRDAGPQVPAGGWVAVLVLRGFLPPCRALVDVVLVVALAAQRGHRQMGCTRRVVHREPRHELCVDLLNVRRSSDGGIGPCRRRDADSLERIVGARGAQGEDVAHVGGSRVPRRERRKSPTCLHGLQDGGVVQRNGPRGSEDGTGRNEGRHEHGGHANPEPGEVETELARTGVRRHGPGRGSHMVVTPAVLVVGHDEKCLVPVRTVPERVIDVVNQLLAQGDVVVGMLTVPR